MQFSSASSGSWFPSPSDFERKTRDQLAATLLLRFGNQKALGTLARSRLILQILLRTYPTQELSAAYFENLHHLLSKRETLPSPGRLVLGLGSGRCGSTSLTALMATVDGSLSTHENPPMIFWEHEEEQVAFHVRRFTLLRRYFPLVFDASHWWLNVIDELFAIFPDAKGVGLHRDLEGCVQSFMHVKERGPDTVNHWVSPVNGIWQANNWDPAYPTYPIPESAHADPDRAKAGLIRRYISEYNRDLKSLADRFRGRIMLIRTENLGCVSEQQRLFRFVGRPGRPMRVHLNAGTVTDGQSLDYRF